MKKVMLFLVAGVILFGSSALFADETIKNKGMKDKDKWGMMMKMTPEQRESMAKAHEQMAGCLRSDKKVSDCKDEMMKSCEKTMGKDCMKMMHHEKMKMEVKKEVQKQMKEQKGMEKKTNAEKADSNY